MWQVLVVLAAWAKTKHSCSSETVECRVNNRAPHLQLYKYIFYGSSSFMRNVSQHNTVLHIQCYFMICHTWCLIWLICSGHVELHTLCCMIELMLAVEGENGFTLTTRYVFYNYIIFVRLLMTLAAWAKGTVYLHFGYIERKASC